MKFFYATVSALMVLGLFVLFANWVPQVGWRTERLAPTVEMSPEELAKIGQRLVVSRGCMICHTIDLALGRTDPKRAPNLFDVGGRSTLAYLVESLYEPTKEVVPGYPPIMPVVTGPPANLTYEEIVAVINYLQSLGGRPSVRIGQIPRPLAKAPEKAATLEPKAIMAKYGCNACHAVAGEGGTQGPPLDRAAIGVAAQQRGLSLEEYIRESILNPQAYVVGGFLNIMPTGFGQALRPEELEALVKFLLKVERR